MSYLKDYIKFLHDHESTHCSKKLGQMYFNDIEPIVDGNSEEYYFDEEAGLEVIRFIQGDIPSSEVFNEWLNKVPKVYKSNKEKVDYIEKQGVFLGFIRQAKGQWLDLPLVLELFQKAYLEALYGIKRKSNDRRRFTDSWLEIGRKNGKTSLQVPIALYALFEEPGARVYAASTTYAQSRDLWDKAVEAINASPALSAVLKSRQNPEAKIIYEKGRAKFSPLSKNIKTKDGLNSSCNIIDGAHTLPSEIYNLLKESTSITRQPLTNIITTAGYVRGALFDSRYEYYTKVLNGTIKDDTVLILIYELDDPDEVNDKSKWYKANPGLGTIKQLSYLEHQVKEAEFNAETRLSVKTKDFNIIGVNKNAWLDAKTINLGCYGPYDSRIIDNPKLCEQFLSEFDNSTVLGGYDLSRIGDVTAFTTALFDKAKGCIIFKTMYWITQAFLSSPEARSSLVPWEAWINRGYVRLSSDKEVINYHEVADYVYEEFQKHGYYYDKIAYDPWSAQYLTQELADLGWSKDYIQTPIRQGYQTLSVPIQTLEVYLKSSKICYLNNPVTKWMLTNVEVVPDRNGNLLPQKVNQNRANKIDGPATFFNIFAIFCDSIGVYLE